MTLPRSLLSESSAREIKEQLWAGHDTQTNIAHRFNVSQPTISRIFRGVDWRHLPWPDGSTGHIPIERRATIHASRNRNTRYLHDTRARSTELAPKEASDISEVVENLLSTEDGKLRNLISRKAGETRRRAKGSDGVGSGTYRGDMLPWPDIKELDPGHPIVQALVEEDDPVLKVALRIVCAKIPQAEWQKAAALEAIETEAARIREKIS
jgi:hypothetical protein